VSIIEEKYFDGLHPAPAYTDFRRIFISRSLSGHQMDVMRKHARCHIWLQHNVRKPQNANSEMWELACDAEIALNIYTDEDDYIINRPRSLIASAITRQNLPKDLPKELIFAEEIYDWLAAQPEAKQLQFPKSQDGQANSYDDSGDEKNDENLKPDDILDLISKTKNFLENLDKEKSQKAQSAASRQTMEEFKESRAEQRKFTLYGAIEAELTACYVVSRKKSFRRPSRRENPDFIQKGVAKTRSRPHIIVYCDRSASFDEKKTREATEKISDICRKYRANIKVDVLYFNEQILSEDPPCGEGNTNYKAVRDNIFSNNPEIAIVITDDDNCEELSPVTSKVLVVPIGTKRTFFATRIGGKDVV